MPILGVPVVAEAVVLCTAVGPSQDADAEEGEGGCEDDI